MPPRSLSILMCVTRDRFVLGCVLDILHGIVWFSLGVSYIVPGAEGFREAVLEIDEVCFEGD